MRVKNNRKELIKAALGLVECDLAIKNAQLLNVFTGEVYPATVFVYDGAIAHVEYRNLEEGLDKVKVVVDAEGKYLIPGLIDAHMHIESSMLTPRNFAQVVQQQLLWIHMKLVMFMGLKALNICMTLVKVYLKDNL